MHLVGENHELSFIGKNALRRDNAKAEQQEDESVRL
jgi:hypothetical protein